MVTLGCHVQLTVMHDSRKPCLLDPPPPSCYLPLHTQVPELHHSPVPFAHLAFSNDGKTLVAVVEGRILILDAFTGGCGGCEGC